jgi:hypothetical protein
LVVKQPVEILVQVIVTAPTLIPVTAPDALPTVPIAELLLDHAPPDVAQLSVVDEPTTTEDAPVIVAGNALTTMVAVL